MSDKNGIKKLGQGVTDVARASTGVAAAGASVLGTAGRTGGGAVNGAAGLTGGMLSTVARVITKHPKLTFLAGLYAGVKGVQHMVSKNKQKNAEAVAPVAESYDPRAFGGAQQESNFRPVSEAAAQEVPAELREMLAQQQMAAAQQAPAQGVSPEKWTEQVDQKRNQAQGSNLQV